MSVTAIKKNTKQSDLSNSALKLLQFEAEVRACSSEKELMHHLVNQLYRLISYDMGFCFERKNIKTVKVTVISDLSDIEESSPLISKVNDFACSTAPNDTTYICECTDFFDDNTRLPSKIAGWFPIKERQVSRDYYGHYLLLFRKDPFTEQQKLLLERLMDVYGHAFSALKGASVKPRFHGVKKKLIGTSVFVLMAFIAWLPFPLSVMAPFEVVAKDPSIITAPFNGVIKTIDVLPNSQVEVNNLLLTFEDTDLRNELLISQQKLAVVQAKLDKLEGQAFTSSDSMNEVSVVRTELALAFLEIEHAVQKLEQTKIKSDVSGLVIYHDKDELEGRPVQVGEQILQVAVPNRISYRIDLPVSQLINFQRDVPITLYLDNAPFGGNSATFKSASYSPRISSEGIASYTIIADHKEGMLPIIGARGTARIYADDAPLIWHLLRRPVNHVRQWLGI